MTLQKLFFIVEDVNLACKEEPVIVNCTGITPMPWSRMKRILRLESYAMSWMFTFLMLRFDPSKELYCLSWFFSKSIEKILAPLSEKAAAKKLPSIGFAL